ALANLDALLNQRGCLLPTPAYAHRLLGERRGDLLHGLLHALHDLLRLRARLVAEIDLRLAVGAAAGHHRVASETVEPSKAFLEHADHPRIDPGRGTHIRVDELEHIADVAVGPGLGDVHAHVHHHGWQ